jgi:hypothetical protein
VTEQSERDGPLHGFRGIIPHTVRLTGCANNPATIIVNVSKVGAVKHGRKVASTRVSAPGRVGTRSIGGTLFRLLDETVCQLCPERPATRARLRLCLRHHGRWWRHRVQHGDQVDFMFWLDGAQPFPGFGRCRVVVCSSLSDSAIGLCAGHTTCYGNDGRPGGADVSEARDKARGMHERHGTPIPVRYSDEAAFHRWCASATPVLWPGQINLRGLRPLVRAEIQWCLFAYTQRSRPGRWDLKWLQRLANLCRERDLNSLVDLDLEGLPRFFGGLARIMLHLLRLVYFTPAEARDAGFVETDHFGVRFPHRASHIDLTAVGQRWLRNLLWDYLADLLRSPSCPRSGGPIDNVRRGITELAAFLEIEARPVGTTRRC